MCLSFGRVAFEDNRVSYEELYNSGMVVFGTYPALEVNGRPINQTHAMAAFAGKLSGFYPSDPWHAAKVDEAFAALTDATFCITKTQGMKDLKDKSRVRAQMMCPGGKLHSLLSGLQSLLVDNGRTGLFAGTQVTVADLAVWRAIIWLCSGIVVGVDPEQFAHCFPELVRLYHRVEALPNVQDWKARYPEFYATPEARWKDWRPYPPASFLMEPGAMIGG
jgi:glutathione S-transferase